MEGLPQLPGSAAGLHADAHSQNLAQRRRQGAIWRRVFQLSTIVGVCALMLLMATIVNDSFGYVVWEYSVLPDDLGGDGTPFAELPPERLAELIRGSVSAGVLRRRQPGYDSRRVSSSGGGNTG